MSKLTYTRCGDYYIPDLKLSEQPEAPIGKYGRMRQRYLKEHRPGLDRKSTRLNSSHVF